MCLPCDLGILDDALLPAWIKHNRAPSYSKNIASIHLFLQYDLKIIYCCISLLLLFFKYSWGGYYSMYIQETWGTNLIVRFQTDRKNNISKLDFFTIETCFISWEWVILYNDIYNPFIKVSVNQMNTIFKFTFWISLFPILNLSSKCYQNNYFMYMYIINAPESIKDLLLTSIIIQLNQILR